MAGSTDDPARTTHAPTGSTAASTLNAELLDQQEDLG